MGGSTGRKTSGCPEGVSKHVEKMIELRKNWSWEGSYTGRAPVTRLKIFEENWPEVFETLVDIHSFLQRRWRVFSLADGKAACRSMRLYELTQILSRRNMEE